jgi:signal transduction histidine kinase
MRREALYFVNGIAIGMSHGADVPRRLLCCAALIGVPPHLLQRGENTLHVRVPRGAGAAVHIPPIEFGEASRLWPRYERRLLLDGIGLFTSALLSLTVGGYCLLLWLRRRRETTLLYFGLASVALGTGTAIDFVTARNWSDGWDAPFALLDHGSAALLLVFFLRYANWRWPVGERVLWAWVLASMLLQLHFDFYDPQSPIRLWWYTGCAAYIATLPLMAAITWRRRDAHSLLLLAATTASAALTSWQTWSVAIGKDSAALYLFPYHSLTLLAVIGWILVDRFARSLNESEQLTAELEQRVRAKHAELQTNYERVRVLEQQQAVVAERSRLMSDMHDGIGCQLISTLSLVEGGEASKEQVGAALRECIDDLRLAIDSLEPAEEDLLPVLGNLRYRLEPRLKARGIALDWQVSDVPKLSCLTPGNVLHVLRILQEAFTNVLKHADARVVRVATSTGKHAVSIDISDDGRGFDERIPAQGYGLASMRERARAVGGALSLKTSASGTTLSLLLPTG